MIASFSLHPADHLLFLLLGILIPWQTIGAQRKLKDIQFNQRMRISLYIGNSIGLWVMALVVLALWWWTERPWNDLGLKWTAAATSWWSFSLMLFFLIVYLIDASRDLLTVKGRGEVADRLSKELGILPRTTKSYLLFVPLAFSAGICEEIVFRAYFMGYFISLFGEQTSGQILAVAVPALIFGLVHTYQGRQAIVKIVGMAVVFGTVYLFTGSIFLLIILHVVVDLIGGSIGLFFPEPEPVENTPENGFEHDRPYPPLSSEEE